MKRACQLLLPAAVAACTGADALSDHELALAPASAPVDVHVIALQSNAVGGARVADLPRELAAFTTPYPAVQQAYRIKCPTNGVDGSCTDSAWQDLAPRRGANGPYLGIELSLGRRLDERFAAPIAIVKVATSGTALGQQWEPDAAPGKWQWQYMVEFLDARLLELPAGSRVAGLHLVGCEGDASSLPSARAVDDELAFFAMRFRQEYGADVPVIVAEMSAPGLRFTEEVSARQWKTASYVEGVHVAETGDLSHRDDQHYDAASFITLGRRMADLVPE